MNDNVETIDFNKMSTNTEASSSSFSSAEIVPSKQPMTMDEKKMQKVSILETYGENLNRKEFVTNPAIGREREIEETASKVNTVVTAMV